MSDSIVRNWWVFAVRGAFAILLGVLAFVKPNITLTFLVALFGAYALIDGIAECIAAPSLSGTRYFGWVLLSGILGILVGVLTFVYPGATVVALLYLLSAWLVVTGIFRIAVAIELRKLITDEWLLILSGIVSIAAGVMTASRPNAGLLAWLWVIGIYAIFYGCILMAGGFRLKNWTSPADTSNTALNH